MNLTQKRARHLGASLALFIAVLAISRVAISAVRWGFWHVIVSALPIFPAILLGYQVARAVTELDELQQRLQLEALAFSLANTVLLIFAASVLCDLMFIQYNGIHPAVIAAAIVFFWALGYGMAQRRFK